MAKACRALMKLTNELYEIVQELNNLGKGYGVKQLNPRDIPSDEEILSDLEQLSGE